MWPYTSILKYCWFSGALIPAYWCVSDSHVTSFQHTNVLLILVVPHSSILKYCWFSGDLIIFQNTDVLLIIIWPHSQILMCYWFWCDLIPAYHCVIDSDGTSFQHTSVLLILIWPHSSILKLIKLVMGTHHTMYLLIFFNDKKDLNSDGHQFHQYQQKRTITSNFHLNWT